VEDVLTVKHLEAHCPLHKMIQSMALKGFHVIKKIVSGVALGMVFAFTIIV
jgi:hypothetical protein